MKNPYDVLGVSPSSSDEEIKEAYRRLARECNQDGSASTYMQDRMRELNEAYDAIIQERQNGGTYRGGTHNFSDIRRLISDRRYIQAEELLDGIPAHSRNAEWHYLKGQILYQKGWLEEANRYYNQAASMDPQNPEYRAAVNRSAYQRSGGYAVDGRRSSGCTCSALDVCSAMVCADCCCECMGSDCISCC